LELILANPTGFCFGVTRAIKELENSLDTFGKVYSIGSPIHNPQEVKRLEEKGLVVVRSAEEIPHGSVVFVRAHGEMPDALKTVRQKALLIIDGTCPFVHNAQEKAKFLLDEGYDLFIVGDPEHPEVKAILGAVNNRGTVINDVQTLNSYSSLNRCGIISQTTQSKDFLGSVVSALIPVCNEMRVYNTICKATLERQDAIRQLASMVDGLIIIGGKNSANTSQLSRIAVQENISTLWIEDSEELEPCWFEGKTIIGIAAGASTPDWLINKIKLSLEHRKSEGDGKL